MASGAAAGYGGAEQVSLFVSDLDPSVTEADLFAHFQAHTNGVTSVRVCRDAALRRSLGYGYVNFMKHDDAKAALDDLNFEPLKGRQLRIMWSQRDPSKRRSGVGNIFISGLHADVDNRTLHDTFARFGDILSCKVVQGPDGKSRGIAFVHFKEPESAENAIEKVNGKSILEKRVTVAKYKTRRERMEEFERAEREFTNVYIKNLPEDFTEDKFKELCAPFGEIESQKLIMKEDEPEVCKGYGFVSFKTTDSAHKAVEELNGKAMGEDDNKLFAGRAMKKSERFNMLRRKHEQLRAERSRVQNNNLYIKHLDDSVTDSKLRDMFSEFGTITSAKVARDSETQASRGFGFVCFSTPGEATTAVTNMHGRLVPGNTKPLYVALHVPKDQRRTRPTDQMAQQAMMLQQQQQMMMRMPGGMNPMFYYQQGMAGGRMAGVQPGGMQQRMPYNPNMMNNMRMMQPGAAAAGMPMGNAMRMMQPNPAAAGGAAPAGATADAAAGAQGARFLSKQEKQTYGNQLYGKVEKIDPINAGKIVGMLLESPLGDIQKVLKDDQVLEESVRQIIEALRKKNMLQQA